MNPATLGACLCNAVTFQIAPPYRWFTHCHCSMCRKHHGTLFGTGMGVPRTRFRWLTGATEIVHYRATEAFERPFCRHCGATVPALSHLGDVLHVPAGLIEGDPGARPRTHIFVASKASFHAITDSLPQFAAYPPGVKLLSVSPPVPATTEHGIAGSCLCGAVGFESDANPHRIVNCHCSLCRRSRGTAFASTLFVPAAGFRWTRGRDRIHSYRLPRVHGYETHFCGACGSLVPTVAPGTQLASLPAGAIDTLLPPLPAVHLFVASKAAWHEITDAWPQVAARPPPQELEALLR